MSSNSNKRARLEVATSTAMGSIASASSPTTAASSPTTAAASLSNPSIACSLVGFLTTRELGRLMLQTNKDMTQAFLGSETQTMNLWNVLCESRWKNSKHVVAIRQHTGLSDEAIFRCFAYSSPTTTSAEDGQPRQRQQQPLTLPSVVPPLQYTPEDYVMVMDVRHDDATDDKLLLSFVLPGQEILDFFRHGETQFMELDEPTFLTTFQARCEQNGERLYDFPDNLPPFQIKMHLWRRGHEYVELFHSTNCIPQGFDFWSIEDEGDDNDNDIIAEVCGYETAFTVERAFPPLSERLEQLLPLLNANDGIEFSTSLLFNVHYSRRRQEQTARAAARDGEKEEESTSVILTTNATINITSVSISGKSGDFYLDQTFSDQEGEVEFAHLLEAMEWKDAV